MTMSALRKGYLVVYNGVQAAGWAYTLLRLYQDYHYDRSYNASRKFTGYFQLVSFLEILHAVVGIVPSKPHMAFLQWLGRSHVFFAVVQRVPDVQSSVFVAVLILCWGLSEVIRYPWYALSTLEACPGWLTWLRYTVFIPLYPVGVAAEMKLLWDALPFAKREQLYSISLPNKLNFGFDYAVFVQVVLVLYLPLWWQLYSSLLAQRKKRLGAAPKRKEA